jgi:hypothetical protein
MSYPFEDPLDDMTDNEIADFEQAFQEAPSIEELDRMFAWWEAQCNE